MVRAAAAGRQGGALARTAGRRVPASGWGTRAGFTLVETLIALLLLGCAALAAASAEAWAARMTALAEAREGGAAAAELVLDSLAAVPSPGPGSRREGGLRLDWVVVPGPGGAEVRLRVTTVHPAGEAWFGAIAAPPPEPLEAGP